MEALRRGAHLMLPLPGEALWGALSANDKAHIAVENGSRRRSLRVFDGEEEYACFARDAQHGEETQRRRLLDSYGESLSGRTGSHAATPRRNLEELPLICPT